MKVKQVDFLKVCWDSQSPRTRTIRKSKEISASSRADRILRSKLEPFRARSYKTTFDERKAALEAEILRPAEFESKHGRDPTTVFRHHDTESTPHLRPSTRLFSRLVSIYARTLEIDIWISMSHVLLRQFSSFET